MITNTFQKNDTQEGFFRKNKTAIIFAFKIMIAAGLLIYLASSIEYAKIISAIEHIPHESWDYDRMSDAVIQKIKTQKKTEIRHYKNNSLF